MPGTIFTFYSYKGGVGRSFTLANIAVLLARWGHRVLCLDWDLEAPGLGDYFRPRLPARPRGGVVDLIDDFRRGRFEPEAHVQRLEGVGVLDFLAAGTEEPGYVGQVQAIDWDDLYDEGFGEYLEKCRDQWVTRYDYVLIDSRTGISDIGGICTAHLPDHLVLLFTANRQSITGAMDAARRADAARNLLPFDRARLTVLPVLSRFDNREEYDRSEAWRRIVVDETAELYRTWLDQTVEPATMARHLTLPYVSYWSFGEQLPVLSEQSPSADQIGFALETVAAVIACRLDRTDLLAENRDAYVAAVRTSRREFRHELRVSIPRPLVGTADDLVIALKNQGVRVVKSLSGDRSLLARTEDDARHLCLLVDGKVSRWQSAEVELFLHRTLGQDRRVIPVLTAGTDAAGLPGYVGNLRYLRLGGSRGVDGIARELAGQLKGVVPLAETDDLDLAALLGQTRGSRLRASRWDLVDELVTALQTAVGAGDSGRIHDLAADLEVAVRPRSPNDAEHQAAPPKVRQSIDWLLRTLDARAQTTTKPNHRRDLG
ncbi:CATRA system-associated protein [Amycolatopsis kentuckyensis]|uniref:CATRA system-associated protein n=1 Tax=Amycolatopsis kentuckyensis TaxID=218823 RepID=UPI003562D1BF